MRVPQTLPASRVTVENSAVANASIRPTMASRNRTQTCESPSRGKRGEAEFCGLVGVRSAITLLIRLLSGAGLLPAYDSGGESGSDRYESVGAVQLDVCSLQRGDSNGKRSYGQPGCRTGPDQRRGDQRANQERHQCHEIG